MCGDELESAAFSERRLFLFATERQESLLALERACASLPCSLNPAPPLLRSR